jgi:hypothetical protein
MMFPACPPVRIRRVEATFSPSRNSVANSKIVGKVETSVLLPAFIVTISNSNEIVMFVASRMSRASGETGVISVTISPRTPIPIAQSA